MPKLECQSCGQEVYRDVISDGTVLKACSDCVRESWDPADLPKPKRPSGFHRGWKFMKQFVHENGTVYYKGEEQPDLKDTLPPTPKKETKKDTRSKSQKAADRQDILVGINKLKKKIKKEQRVTYRRKLETQLNKLNKQL
jgi:hypothetical protein